jgi:hypothetical protein
MHRSSIFDKYAASTDMPQQVDAHDSSQIEPKTTPFFHSFKNGGSSFTFSSTASLPSVKHEAHPTFFTFPDYPSTTMPASTSLDVLIRPRHRRTIFDKLHDRHRRAFEDDVSSGVASVVGADIAPRIYTAPSLADTDEPDVQPDHAVSTSPPTPSSDAKSQQGYPVTSAEEAIDALTPEYDICSALGLSKQPNLVFSKLTLWAQRTAEQLHQLYIAHSCLQDWSASKSSNHITALVLYNAVFSDVLEQSQASRQEDYSARISFVWDSQPIFFVSPSDQTHLVDPKNSLYNIEMLLDDDASDFDSIASPMKHDSKVAWVYDDIDPTSLGESLEGQHAQSAYEHVETNELYQRLSSLDTEHDVEHMHDLLKCQPVQSRSEQDLEQAFIDPEVLYDRSTGSSPPSNSWTMTLSDYHQIHAVLSKTKINTDKDATCPSTFHWANELMRMTLGTESLFTFLEHLETSEDGMKNNLAIAAAYLKLVNLERGKLGELTRTPHHRSPPARSYHIQSSSVQYPSLCSCHTSIWANTRIRRPSRGSTAFSGR